MCQAIERLFRVGFYQLCANDLAPQSGIEMAIPSKTFCQRFIRIENSRGVHTQRPTTTELCRQFGCIALPEDTLMKSHIVKRSIVVAGHKTSVSLEEPFWRGLKDIAHRQQITLSRLVSEIDTPGRPSNLSSSIRLYVLDHIRAQLPRFSADRVEADTMVRENGHLPGHTL